MRDPTAGVIKSPPLHGRGASVDIELGLEYRNPDAAALTAESLDSFKVPVDTDGGEKEPVVQSTGTTLLGVSREVVTSSSRAGRGVRMTAFMVAAIKYLRGVRIPGGRYEVSRRGYLRRIDLRVACTSVTYPNQLASLPATKNCLTSSYEPVQCRVKAPHGLGTNVTMRPYLDTIPRIRVCERRCGLTSSFHPS